MIRVAASSPYARTAIAKGLSPRQVLRGHLLRNCLSPVITLAGLDIAIYPPGSKNIASSFRGSLDHTRSASAVSLLHARNATGKDGYFLVQASSRRGWGAYRLRWNVTPART